VAGTKPDGSPWDLGGGPEGDLAAKAIVASGRYLVVQALPTAEMLVDRLLATEQGRQTAQSLRSWIGQQAAPDPVLVVQTTRGALETPVVRNSFLAGWDDPFFEVAGNDVTEIVVGLWDMDLMEHDSVGTWRVPVQTLIERGQLVLEAGQTVVLVEALPR